MKKLRLCAFLLAIILMLPILSGCHGGVSLEPFEVMQDFDQSKEYEITFWAKSDTNVKQTRVYEQAIKDFQALYPNIKVTLKIYTDYGKIYNDVITNIPTMDTPNVCITYPDHIATYLRGNNTVIPLEDLIHDPQYGLGGSKLKFDGPEYDEIIEKYLNECKINGGQYALPFLRSTEMCYINKDYVEKLGYTVPDVLTWDFIFEVAEAATEKNEDGTFKLNGGEVMIPFIYKSTDNMMIQMLEQLDAGYSNDEGEILIFNDTTRSLLDEIAKHASTRAFSTFKISSYPANYLNAGQCVFAIDSTAGATWMGTDAPLSDIDESKLVEFETVVRMIPQYDPQSPKMISQGPSICIFNKSDPGEVMASWLFMQYLLTNDVQIAYSQTEGYVPVTKKAQEDERYVDYLSREGEDNDLYYDVKLKATKLLIENTENTFITPVFNGSASLRNAAGQMIENVTKSVRRNETVDDAYYKTLYSDISSLYRLDQRLIMDEGKSDLGELPLQSKLLLITLGAVWSGIIGFSVYKKVKNNKKIK